MVDPAELVITVVVNPVVVGTSVVVGAAVVVGASVVVGAAVVPVSAIADAAEDVQMLISGAMLEDEEAGTRQ